MDHALLTLIGRRIALGCQKGVSGGLDCSCSDFGSGGLVGAGGTAGGATLSKRVSSDIASILSARR